jgi:transposase InsO family protein
MIGLICFLLAVVASSIKSKLRLEAENAVLRHQLNVLRRSLHGRVRVTNNDRWFLIQLYRWIPSHNHPARNAGPVASGRLSSLLALEIELAGRAPANRDRVRALIRQMSTENQLWGAPRIHGECSSLGLASLNQPSRSMWSSGVDLLARDGGPFCETTRRTLPPWICSWFPTIGFKLLYVFLIVRIDRRDLVSINVTTNPTKEWVARQITEAFPWDGAPGYMIRDRDRIYGAVVTRRLRAMGIRDKPIAPASPWQNGFAERLIGSIRRECLDHVIVLGEAHLRRILKSYARYYNGFRTQRSLNKDTANSWPVQRSGLFRYTQWHQSRNAQMHCA